jgi:hypothetical protein
MGTRLKSAQERVDELEAELRIQHGMILILNNQLSELRRKVDTHIGNDFRDDTDGNCGIMLVPGDPPPQTREDVPDPRCLNVPYDHRSCMTCDFYSICFSGQDVECKL